MKKRSGLFVFNFFLFIGIYAQREVADSLNEALLHSGSDTAKTTILNALGRVYSIKKPDSAIWFYEEQGALSKRIGYVKGEISSLLGLGRVYRSVGDALKAGKAWQRAIELSEATEDSVRLVDALNSYGYIYFLQNDLEKELSLYKRAAQIATKIGHDYSILLSFSNIGNVYEGMGFTDSAELAYQRAMQVTNHVENYYALARTASIKRKKDQTDSAIYYVKKSSALINGKDQFKNYLVDNYVLTSELFLEKNELDSGWHYANESFKVAGKTFDSSNLIGPANLLARLYAEKKDYETAFYYLNLSKSLTEKSQATSRQKEIFNLSFEQEQKEKELRELRIKYRQEVKFYSLIAFAGLLIIGSFFLFRNNRQKQRAKTKIEKAYAELKSAQAQLIQSEKMASLGELTAGIAHEIQNPLNFVNNFSEVSRELIEELKSLRKESLGQKSKLKSEEQDELLNDIDANIERVLQHGKRADAIVRGMLQHSRISTGQKEPTDINSLCDQYMRLAYHGLRAKDKSFNAATKTEFDNTIGKIHIVPQDIGRVLLNLLNNAFYAASEKQKQNTAGDEPTVILKTKKMTNKILISVADNGNGIPDAIKEKIFQPFFTTKPTGQGTGLGLSLAYDIVKAHGGEIKVESKENEGSIFTIQLSVS